MSRTKSETTANATPLDVYSRPFVPTSTDTWPVVDAVTLHEIADSLTYAAGTTVLLKRHRSAPIDSAADEKPLPSTVSGVPPSDAPDKGHTDETAAAGRYVNEALLCENCWPLADSDTPRAPADDDGGDEHSSCDGLI